MVKEATTVQPYEPSTASYTPLTQTESHSEPVKSEYGHRVEGEMTTSQPYTEQVTRNFVPLSDTVTRSYITHSVDVSYPSQVTFKYTPTSTSSYQIHQDPDPFFDRPDEAPRAKPIYGFGPYSRPDSLDNPLYSNGYSRPLPSIPLYQVNIF